MPTLILLWNYLNEQKFRSWGGGDNNGEAGGTEFRLPGFKSSLPSENLDKQILSEPHLSSVLTGDNNSTCPKFVLRHKEDSAGKPTGLTPGTY